MLIKYRLLKIVNVRVNISISLPNIRIGTTFEGAYYCSYAPQPPEVTLEEAA